ncbi:hypothetical protein [Bacillus dakarensis]|uniref:hypothetical protein n=1 Tax=Robertmurraya dakarensis TaxID=1926278 RepID=UPI0012B6AC2E|nr:hypothetical protein [Bacillus dakarensis]
MDISDKLTKQDFQEILLNTYQKGQESEMMEVVEFVNEIKKQFLTALSKQSEQD